MGDEAKDKATRTDSQDFIEAADAEQVGFLREFLDFLMHNKKWWLTPIIVVLLLLAVLIALGGSAAAPFIYTLF